MTNLAYLPDHGDHRGLASLPARLGEIAELVNRANREPDADRRAVMLQDAVRRLDRLAIWAGHYYARCADCQDRCADCQRRDS